MSDTSHSFPKPWWEQAIYIKGEDADRLCAVATKLLEALRGAQAAVWDSYYGKGISLEYARLVDSVARTAIREAEERQ